MYALGVKGVLRYYVPSLGVEITAVGPMTRRILDTLTRSPRAVVFAPGPEPVVSSDWNRLTYEGLAFAAPRSWPVIRTTQNVGIGHCSNTGAIFFGPNVILSTDNGIAAFRCFDPGPTPQFPQDGVQVDVGTQTLSQLAQQGLRLTFSSHCLSLHGLTACSATAPAYSILVLRVTVPGRSKPVYVSIGLAGNGMVARTILYSLRAVSPGRTTRKPTGVVTGVAYACVGVRVSVGEVFYLKVSLYSALRSVASETVRSGNRYRLTAAPGVYALKVRQRMATGTDQPYPPRTVVVRAGRSTTANFRSVCL